MADPKVSNKKKILLGVFFVGLGLIFLVGVFYLLINSQQAGAKENADLREQLAFLKTEKETEDHKVEELQQAVGKSVRLEKVLETANQTYDAKEKERREGYLWVDREGQTWVITLGALNGVSVGSRLAVYDGDKKIGTIKVKTPLDVISYVQPVDKSVEELKDDYYRVVLEH